MEQLPSLLRLSFEGMVFAVAIPWFWGALAVMIAAAWLIRRRPVGSRRPDGKLVELLLPFAFPLAILVWATALYASLEGRRAGWYWQELGIFALLLMQVITIVWLLMRHQRRLYLALIASAAAICWAVGALFIAGMAVYNDWL